MMDNTQSHVCWVMSLEWESVDVAQNMLTSLQDVSVCANVWQFPSPTKTSAAHENV
ncbi:MAG: hypothetical protein IKO41_12545 [Lachnospiraceae bacterium]|nr:hypothetical protein [Lachnospiraceae bacterium]